jgi:integrase/recombinase XerC
MHFENTYREFLNHIQAQGKSPNTQKNYRTDLECFKEFLILKRGGLNMDQLDSSIAKEFSAYLDHKYTSDNTRRRRAQTVRIYFDFLVQKNLFLENPMRKLPSSPKFLDVPHPTSFNEIRILWDSLDQASQQGTDLEKLMALRNKVLVALIYGSGLKVSDLAALSQQQISLSPSSIRILVTPLKRDPYTIPLPHYYFDLLDHYFKALGKEKTKQGLVFDELFFNANPFRILSGGLTPRGIEMIFEDFREKLKIQITAKSLRQSCIYRWLQEKQDETSIKEWMGVAPSYSLKLYQDSVTEAIFSAIN